MCNLIEAQVVAPGAISYSNIPAQDYATWDVGTTYAAGDRVTALSSWKVGGTVVAGYRVYKSLVASNLGIEPTADAGSNWLDEGPTSRMRPFDGTSSVVSASGSLVFEVTTDITWSVVSIFGAVGTTWRVQVWNSTGDLLFDQTRDLVSYTAWDTWWDVFFGAVEYKTRDLMVNLPQGPNRRVRVTIDAGASTASVAAISGGKQRGFGITRPGSYPKLESFSDLGENEFGDINVVPRKKIRTVTYKVSYETLNTDRLFGWVVANTDKLVIVYPSADAEGLGLLVYGIITYFEPPGEHIRSEGRLEIRGVTT